MALLVLLVVWGALIATWLRSRAQDGSFSDPVGTFNRHLRILENTAPNRFPAANQRRPPRSGAIAPYRPAPSAGLGPLTPPHQVRPSSATARRRAQSRKRRRDVFFALLAGVLGSLVLGVIPGLHVLLFLQVFFDVAMVAYVALLVRMRNLAAEREVKLAYLSNARRPPQPGGHAHAPVRAREAYAPVSGYDDTGGYGYDYGDLAVRRAAN